MKELAPRLWAGHGLHLYECDVTVLVFPYQGTSGDFLVKTTCLMLDGPERLQRVIEYWTALDCRLLVLLAGFPVIQIIDQRRELAVWTSPVTLPRGPVRSPKHLFDGCPCVRCTARKEGRLAMSRSGGRTLGTC